MSLPTWRLIVLAAIASFCANWSFAFQVTYVNTSVDTFYRLANRAYKSSRQCFWCSIPEKSWLEDWSIVVSSFYPGTIVGFLMVPFLTSYVGVKRSQGLMCISATLGILVHFLVPSNLFQGEAVFCLLLILGRFLVGLQAGSSLCLLPLYIIEISPPRHRAFLNSFQQVAQSLATLLGLLLGSEEVIPLGGSRFAWLQVFALIPIVILLFLLAATPPTPTYLVNFKPKDINGKRNAIDFYFGEEMVPESKYRRALSYTSARSISLTSEMGIVYPSDLPLRNSLKGFAVGAIVAVSYAFTGDDLIDTFSSQMLADQNGKAGLVHQTTDTFARLVSDALGVVLFLASVIGVFLVDRYGRRNLVLVGLFGTCVANVGASLGGDKILVSAFYAITKAFIGLGCGGPAWFLTSELVRPEHAWLFQPISTGLLLTSTMIVTFCFLYVEAAVGSFSLLILAAAPAFIAATLIFLFLPETKGKNANEVQHSLSSSFLCGLKLQPSNLHTAKRYGTFSDDFD